MFNKIIVIGLGLIGGSLAKACRKNNIAKKIVGFDINKSSENLAISNKIIDEVYSFDQNITNDDLVIIAAPLSCYEEILNNISPNLDSSTLIIDVGSLKNFVFPLSEKFLKEKSSNFIACHPIAGSEKSGVANADENLFSGKKVIISKNHNNQNAINKAELFWKQIGCNVDFVDAKEHDKIFALVSHLPQFLSFMAYEDIKADDELLKKHLRLQNSNPKIWQEIFSLNRTNIEHYLGFYLKNVEVVVDWLEKNKYEEVIKFMDPSLRWDDGVDNKSAILNEYVIPAKAGIHLAASRVILVSCFLNLPDIKKYQTHAGTGFKDFTAISSYAQYLSPQILKNEQQSLIEGLNQIKSKISNYEFS